MCCCAYVVCFHYKFRRDLALNAEEKTIDVGVFDSLRENDSGQLCLIGVRGRPTVDVSGCLRADTLSRVGGSSREGRDRRCVWTANTAGAGGRTIDDIPYD